MFFAFSFHLFFCPGGEGVAIEVTESIVGKLQSLDAGAAAARKAGAIRAGPAV